MAIPQVKVPSKTNRRKRQSTNERSVESAPVPVNLESEESKNRLLLVDDDEGVRAALAAALAGEGLDVITACDGREAMRLFVDECPDLVLMDVNMPGMNGWEAFANLERERPFIPVIVITAYPSQYARANGMGIDALMEKPIDLPLLTKTIWDLLAEEPQQRVHRLASPGFATRDLTPADAVDSAVERGWPIA